METRRRERAHVDAFDSASGSGSDARRSSHNKLFASIPLGHHQRRTESASDALFRTELRFQRATERTYEERCKPTKENQRNN